MTPTETNALIAALAAAISAVVSACAVLVSALGLRRTKAVEVKVEQVHVATNSMKDELVAEVRAAAFNAGRKEAQDEADARDVARKEQT